jgi:hypothetical protein
MKRLMVTTLSFICLTGLVCLAQEPANQDNAKQAAAQEKQAMPSRIVTGCLQKGLHAAEFSITGEDGKTWDVSSDTVKFDEHVGHQVALTGSARRDPKGPAKAEQKKEGQMEKAADKEGYGDLRVTGLRMISETCTSK